MDIAGLTEYGLQIEDVMEGSVPSRTEAAVRRMVEEQRWDLFAALLISASEIPARRMVDIAMEREKYEPLVVAACLRRQIQRGIPGGAGGRAARRVFRDMDEEAPTQGVPEHIQLEAQEIRDMADRAREAAIRRDQLSDRDPVREAIVNGLAQRLQSDAALDALIAIAKASAWEATRRRAAMKIANHPGAVNRLAMGRRLADISAVVRASGLKSVAAKLGEALAGAAQAAGGRADRETLEFIAAHHPNPAARDAAAKALEG
jgi:hypothetical protein